MTTETGCTFAALKDGMFECGLSMIPRTLCTGGIVERKACPLWCIARRQEENEQSNKTYKRAEKSKIKKA